jgi:N-acetylglucosamine-6-phosphate deacetylase
VGPLVVHSARLSDARGVVDDGWVYADNGSIQATGTGTTWRSLLDRGADVEPSEATSRVLDAGGRTVTPGFVDLHAHGGAGHRFEDGGPGLAAALRVHRRHGTTRSVLSLATADLASLTRCLGEVAALARSDPRVLGSHLEGPYLSPGSCGAHDPAALRMPQVEEMLALADAARGTLRQVTIAPELPGAREVIRHMTARGVVAAVGHTEADYAQTRAAFDAGATLLTHAYNAMPGIGHRAPGPVVAAFDDERARLELINDGHHVDPRIVALTFARARDRVAMVSDAMAATGHGDGDYKLGNRDVTVTDRVARLAGTQTLAGSTITVDVAVRRAMAAGVSETEAVAAVTAVPASVLGLGDRFGRLSAGFAADLVVLDADWRVRQVFCDGIPVD